MTAPFRLYGAELSPYSVKVRSYLRFKGLAFEWLERSNARQEEFSRYAKLPLAPILVDADENAMQDSTPMIEALEREYAEPSITPDDASLAFLSALLEDYADEWLNKAMFHYRWAYPENQDSAAKRIVDMLFEGAPTPDGMEDAVKTRMIGRLHHVGSTPETAPLIEGSFTRVLATLDRMLAANKYLFGGRPSLADFGLAGQLGQLRSDPTPGAIIKAQAPNVSRWLDRMDSPGVEGGFASLPSLQDDLASLLREEIAGAYLVWMAANAQAVRDDAPGVTAFIAGETYTQKPQRYAAKAFAELRRKRALVTDEALAALLGDTGCDAFLASPPGMATEEPEVDDEGDDDGED
ncbi:glutathione S-transferase [alpha proteobacterium U9-1i]|nr:glutathione S-transferase [alpha proteobacterium U9-1i]